MAIAVSIVAVLISIASLIFSFYQYKNNQKISKMAKTNEIFRHAYEFRKNLQDARDRISRVDDVDDHELEFSKMCEFLDTMLSPVLDREEVTLEEIYQIERSVHDLELEFSLLVKQIDYLANYNEELKTNGFSPITLSEDD